MVGLVPGGDGATAGAVSVAAGEHCGAPGEKPGKNLDAQIFCHFSVSGRVLARLPFQIFSRISASSCSGNPALPQPNKRPPSSPLCERTAPLIELANRTVCILKQ